jgi:hypothetical protein
LNVAHANRSCDDERDDARYTANCENITENVKHAKTPQGKRKPNYSALNDWLQWLDENYLMYAKSKCRQQKSPEAGSGLFGSYQYGRQ